MKSARAPGERVVFANGRVIFPDEVRADLDVVVENGKIAELRPRSASADAIDLRGDYLAPGFVDLHVHGAIGRDTMEATADAFRAICDYHLRGGTTSLLLTTVTAPLDDVLQVIDAVERTRLREIGGVHVEGPFISHDKAGAHNSFFITAPTGEAVSQFLEKRDLIKRVTIAPEIHGALEAIAAFAAAGMSVSGGHSNAWDEEARAAFAAGMRSVTHTFNCMSSARRRGIERVAGLLEFALSEPGVSCELIADGHHVAPTLMKMLYRAKGPNGICLVTDAIAGAGLPEGTAFELGGRKCIVENGACLLADRSALAGSAASMIDLVRVMVNKVGVPLHEAAVMASRNPARQIGLRGKGEIVLGNDADLVVITPELRVQQVFVAGDVVFQTES